MNTPDYRERNRRLGLILCLLFVGLFVIVTAAIITGRKVPSPFESAVSGFVVPLLVLIGVLLILGAVVEIVVRIVKNRLREVKTQGHRRRQRPLALILSLLFVGLFIAATVVFVIVFEAPPLIENVVSGVVTPILGIIGVLLILGAGVELVVWIVENRVRE